MRTVLIITGGQTPQIVTETVWALARRGHALAPVIVHVVGTTRGEAAFREALADPGEQMAALCAELDIDRPQVTIDVPPCRGAPLADVRTEAEAAAFGDFMTGLIARYAAEPETRIHVSVAGGRKTMSCYAATALSLLARPQDELSHVLVEPMWFEDSGDYWWPYHKPRMARLRQAHLIDGRMTDIVSTAGSRVDMVRTPFPRLRTIVGDRNIYEGTASYAEMVDMVNDPGRSRPAVLDCSRRALRLGVQEVILPPRGFAIYRLLAAAARHGWLLPGEFDSSIGRPGALSVHSVAEGVLDDLADGKRIDIAELLLRYYDAAHLDEGERSRAEEAVDSAREQLSGTPQQAQRWLTRGLNEIREKLAEKGGTFAERLSVRSKVLYYPIPPEKVVPGTKQKNPHATWYWLEAHPEEVTSPGPGSR